MGRTVAGTSDSRPGAAPHRLLSGAVKAHPLRPGRVVGVGRGTDSEIRIDAPSISRRHFSIREGAPALIEDLASANGTRLNGVRLPPNTPSALEIGNLIEAGGIFFMLQDHGHSTEQITARIEGSTGSEEESTNVQPMGSWKTWARLAFTVSSSSSRVPEFRCR